MLRVSSRARRTAASSRTSTVSGNDCRPPPRWLWRRCRSCRPTWDRSLRSWQRQRYSRRRGCAQADRQTNAARGTGNEQRFPLECRRRHATLPLFEFAIMIGGAVCRPAALKQPLRNALAVTMPASSSLRYTETICYFLDFFMAVTRPARCQLQVLIINIG